MMGLLLAAGTAWAARPGTLDLRFQPELRTWAAPDGSTVGADGQVWVWGGFDRANGRGVGDWLRLGPNGGVAGEPAPGYLLDVQVVPGVLSANWGWPWLRPAPLVMSNGHRLLPGPDGGWLRLDARARALGPAVPDHQAGEIIAPQFERGGKWWIIRKRSDAQFRLERRIAATGAPDAGFTQAVDWPGEPYFAAPGAGDQTWVLASDSPPEDFMLPHDITTWLFRVDGSGKMMGPALRQLNLQPVRLVGAADGGCRVVHLDDGNPWMWPSSGQVIHILEWYSPQGVLLRKKSFPSAGWMTRFAWAEGADGSLVATGRDGALQRFGPDGVLDPTFQSPGDVASVHALPGGKWLIDGCCRLNPDGSDDPTWQVPLLDRPGTIAKLATLRDGRVLAAGDFSHVNGTASAQLCLFLPDGRVDRRFVADARIGQVNDLAVTRSAIYAITRHPVTYGAAITTRLVKLGFNGTLDESYRPVFNPSFRTALPGLGGGGVSLLGTPGTTISPAQLLTAAAPNRIHALDHGDLLVEVFSAMEVATMSVHRLKPDGTPAPGFSATSSFNRFEPVVPTAAGGFVRGGVIHGADGKPARDLSESGARHLLPLCEWDGGILFCEFFETGHALLRQWRRGAWVPSFTPLPLDQNLASGTTATPGDGHSVYLHAALPGGSPALLRLLPDGRLDRSFCAPEFGYRHRRHPGGWWTAGETAKQSWRPVIAPSATPPLSFTWNAASQRLWVGGNFNSVGGLDRDALARLTGGNPPPLRPSFR
ncbi:MAG: hypothetical protein RLZZ522_642 [Verrucomicrobiota bacterium]|jgi:hypothetical protein